MAADDVADVVLSAAVFFEIFGTEDTNSDEDAKQLCTVIRRRRQRPRRYWVHRVTKLSTQSMNNAYTMLIYTALFFNCTKINVCKHFPE